MVVIALKVKKTECPISEWHIFDTDLVKITKNKGKLGSTMTKSISYKKLECQKILMVWQFL